MTSTSQAVEEKKLLITKLCFQLAESLRNNWVETQIKYHKLSLESCTDDRFKDYHIDCIDDLKSGTVRVDFTVETARKYQKIWYNDGNHRSIHAFVDRNTGDVYKPSSTKAPAKGVRFNLINDLDLLMQKADWAGSYLYLR